MGARLLVLLGLLGAALAAAAAASAASAAGPTAGLASPKRRALQQSRLSTQIDIQLFAGRNSYRYQRTVQPAADAQGGQQGGPQQGGPLQGGGGGGGDPSQGGGGQQVQGGGGGQIQGGGGGPQQGGGAGEDGGEDGGEAGAPQNVRSGVGGGGQGGGGDNGGGGGGRGVLRRVVVRRRHPGAGGAPPQEKVGGWHQLRTLDARLTLPQRACMPPAHRTSRRLAGPQRMQPAQATDDITITPAPTQIINLSLTPDQVDQLVQLAAAARNATTPGPPPQPSQVGWRDLLGPPDTNSSRAATWHPGRMNSL